MRSAMFVYRHFTPELPRGATRKILKTMPTDSNTLPHTHPVANCRTCRAAAVPDRGAAAAAGASLKDTTVKYWGVPAMRIEPPSGPFQRSTAPQKWRDGLVSSRREACFDICNEYIGTRPTALGRIRLHSGSTDD